MRLLLCEDEPAIRSAMARGLALDGWDVAAADGIASARALAAQARPDALLSDFKLADGSGLDLARELGVPFCLMSGWVTAEDVIAAMRAGCRDLFTKPASLKEVRARLRTIAAGSGGPWAVDPHEGVAALGSPCAVAWSSQAWSWSDAPSAQAGFAALAATVAGPLLRQAVAELLQCAPQGRLVVMRLGTRQRLWLRAAVDWQEQAARRAWLDALAPGGSWSADGVLLDTTAEPT